MIPPVGRGGKPLGLVGCGQAIYRASLILRGQWNHPNSLSVAMEQPSPLTGDEKMYSFRPFIVVPARNPVHIQGG
jgi:hypothetical protein